MPNRRQHAKQRVDDLLRHFAPTWISAPYYWRLTDAVRSQSQLLSVPNPLPGRMQMEFLARIMRGCRRMAERWGNWHRQPEQWTAPAANPFVVFRSLVTHLFDQYPVPRLMTAVWLADRHLARELDLYLHLAAGRSLRQFRLPLVGRLSKSAAAQFMQAPDDLHPLAAVRWARVRALGGTPGLARVLSTCSELVVPTPHEEFWEAVTRFLVRHEPMSADEVVKIVRFVQRQRFEAAERVWGRGAGRDPVQPNLTLRGRSLRSLRRHMAHWRTELAHRFTPVEPARTNWLPSPIGPFRWVTGDTVWTIDEILTDRELRAEGGIMRHCVATYIHRCARRRTSIWSMKVDSPSQRKRVLTIEVDPRTRRVWQAKGKRNSLPHGEAKEMLIRWVQQESLDWDTPA